MNLKDLPVGHRGYIAPGCIVERSRERFEISKYTPCKPAPYGPFQVKVQAFKDDEGFRFYHAYYLDHVYDIMDFEVLEESDSWWVDNFVKLALITAIVISIAYLITRNY